MRILKFMFAEWTGTRKNQTKHIKKTSPLDILMKNKVVVGWFKLRTIKIIFQRFLFYNVSLNMNNQIFNVGYSIFG